MLQRKILLVDDQPINRAILRKMLNGEYHFWKRQMAEKL
jgi:CheY-like chemotaxis protein